MRKADLIRESAECRDRQLARLAAVLDREMRRLIADYINATYELAVATPTRQMIALSRAHDTAHAMFAYAVEMRRRVLEQHVGTKH